VGGTRFAREKGQNLDDIELGPEDGAHRECRHETTCEISDMGNSFLKGIREPRRGKPVEGISENVHRREGGGQEKKWIRLRESFSRAQKMKLPILQRKLLPKRTIGVSFHRRVVICTEKERKVL